ncbi:MAG: hypothetical protein BLM47_13100 [Candidatus Reconcilbacillus cellulovorans]|uniref:Probable membrane transporter protein n=1 Tax=Candidatus Reconcilbacillus cellulovorans TaxID=1906605 RepID=A0A2A6DXP0_9BACL|nr:MAG: hypothetical protein BLM47_13100 [Candidatus Reconcilbacillus cellulovorans]
MAAFHVALQALAFLALGTFAAAFGSILGLGGGVVLVPALLLAGPWLVGRPIDHAEAVGTSLAVLIVTAASSVVAYARQKRVDFRQGLLFAATGIPGSFVGAICTDRLSADRFGILFGLLLLALAGLLFVRDRLRPLPIRWRYERTFIDAAGVRHVYGGHPAVAGVIGGAVGFISGLFGIGGGSLFVPAVMIVFRYPAHVATATSMFVILFSAVVGTVTHAAQGHVDGTTALFLAPGAWLGGRIGAWITMRMSDRRLLAVLRVAFVLLALRMIFGT